MEKDKFVRVIPVTLTAPAVNEASLRMAIHERTLPCPFKPPGLQGVGRLVSRK